ncbi:dicarboxylate/amino acid:cation symporter [Treponema sp.]|uniref:dicarboxylate/amino acid:cation symporter n=1 Tax=Treponema sp. TaxID=166 RepID=UPI00388D2237
MKVWIKYLIGTILGIIAAFILPLNIPQIDVVAAGFSEFAIRFGRYALIPLIFFGSAMSLFNLRHNKHILKTSVWTFATIAGSTLILVILGLLTILVVQLPRIPITGEKISEVPAIDLKSLIFSIFPFSGFDSLKDGVYLLPVFVLAAFAGGACASDTNDSKPLLSVFESAMKLCQTMSTFFIEWLFVGLIAVSTYWVLQARVIFSTATFIPLFFMLLVDFLIVAGVIYPLILRFLCKDLHPYHVLYASLSSIITGFFSGDTNLTLLINQRHTKESLGLHDDVNYFSLPLFSIFARGGTALVTSVCFVTILRSYSSLGFTFFDVIWIFAVSFITSFALGNFPAGGTFVALTGICSMYGRGFEAGYLLLKPAVPILCSFAAAFDALSAVTGSYIVAVKTKKFDKIDLKHYI